MTDLDSQLGGTVRLSTDHRKAVLQGPFDRQLAWPIGFAGDRRQVDGTGFPDLQVMALPKITVEFVDLGHGSFDPASGRFELPIKLGVTHLFGQATVELMLSTEAAGGSRVEAATGQVKLVAAGDFDDPGILNGVRCELLVEARFDPNPRI